MPQKPNILLITTDQQRYDTIGAAGYDFIKTPNLDALAKEGCIFDNAYSPNPVCIPARHNILTGLPARYHGFDDNYFVNPPAIPYGLPTFAQIITDSGEYDAIGIGKMHFVPARRHNGFTRLQLMEEIPLWREDDEYAQYLWKNGYGNLRSMHGVRHLLYMQPQRSLVPEERHGSAWVADKTIEYIKKTAGKRPFLTWASFIEPHPPFDVPERFAEMYRGAKLPTPTTSETSLSALARENINVADYPGPDYLTRIRELYFGAISFVDEQIGRILQALDDSGQRDNTLVIFTSDHGEMLGDLGTFQKFLPYDSAAKIPMIIRYPDRIESGGRRKDFVDLNDLLPTMLEAAGCKYPGDIELPGESLLTNQNTKDRTHQYLEYCRGNRRWISLRNARYKYNYYFGGGYQELFDMEEDPAETVNLLLKESDTAVLAARDNLRGRLISYEGKYGLPDMVIRGDLAVLEDYQPVFYRENNYPKHFGSLSSKEHEELLPIEEEIRLAIQKEPTVRLRDLDIETFIKYSGLSRDKVEHLLKTDERRFS